MKITHILPIAYAGSCLCASAALVAGDFVNIDYSTANTGPVPSGTGPINGGSWNSTNSTFQGPGATGFTEGDGTTAVNIGVFASNPVGGTGSSFGWPTGGVGDPLGQDYYFINDNGSDTQDLNGTTVGAFRRFTLFTNNNLADGIAVGQLWNITFIGSGNADGQGLNVMVNNGGSFVTASTSGVNASGFDGTYELGRNYTMLNNISPTTIGGGAELEFWIYTTPGGPASAINGVQLQLVPEPSSSALLGLSGLLLMARRRR